MRCNTCHGSGKLARCPDLAGVFGRTAKLVDGRTVVADEAYLRESILEPNAKQVAGYPANMPTYKGQLNEQDLFRLIAYLKSLQAPRARVLRDRRRADAMPRGKLNSKAEPTSETS